MKYIIALLLPFILCHPAMARDDILMLNIDRAISHGDAKSKLPGDIKFFFADQDYGEVIEDFGNVSTNKKTNAFNKSDYKACRWVFLSAMIALQNRARQEGGNAVVDIKSNYKHNLTSDSKRFMCGAGTIMAGVALTGRVVKIK